MPGNSGVIDLNSDAVSGDQSSDVDGGDVPDLLIRVGVSGDLDDQGGVMGEMADSGEVVGSLVRERMGGELGSLNGRNVVEGACGVPVIDDFQGLVLDLKGGIADTDVLHGKSLVSESNESDNKVRRGRNEVHTVGVAGEDNLIDVKVLAHKVMEKHLENEKEEEEVVQVAETSIHKIFGVPVSEFGLPSMNESKIVNLVVDLNPYIDADENSKSRALISNKARENIDCCIKQLGLNGNHDLVTKGQLKNVKAKDLLKQNVNSTASDLEFEVSDLVWGKVRSHPWWPGQIFNPLDSSDKAMKYFKKDSFLIAYFGDQTFAWNEVAQLKPFRANFSQMEKQSNLEAFRHAVDCALDELARRVEFGLACSCVSEEVRRKIKTQTIVNAGIKRKSSRRDGGDRYLNASSFEPAEILNHIKMLAQNSCNEVDRLEFAISRAQLSAFHHWKGFSQLPEFEMVGGLFGDDEKLPLLEAKVQFGSAIGDVVEDFKDHEQVVPGRRKSKGRNSSPNKHKLSGDSMHPSKRQRSLTDLMADSCSNLKDIEKPSSGKKRKKIGSLLDNSGVGDGERFVASPSWKNLEVGNSICRVANQLNGSSPMFKNEKPAWSGKSQKRKVIPIESFSPEEILSQIRLASVHPMEGYKLLASSIHFLSDFRNSICLDHHHKPVKEKQSLKEVSSRKCKKSIQEAVETSGSKYVKDAYWPDWMIQSSPEEGTFVNLNGTRESVRGTQSEVAAGSVELEAVLDSEHQTAGQSPENEAEESANHMSQNGKVELSPTALILNFADLNSVPSEIELNKIFSRYGPLNESETEVLKKNSRAKVVFKRSSDAETAFSSSGKFSIFGPSLISYRLKYLPAKPHNKASSSSTKRRRKDATTVEGNTT